MKYVIDTCNFPFKITAFMAMGENEKNIGTYKRIMRNDVEELTAEYINEHYGQLQDEAYQRGLEDGKAQSERGCEGCKYQANKELTCPCSECANNYKNQWKAKDDKIEVGDEVIDEDGDKTIVTNIHSDLFDGLCSDGSTMADLFLDDNRKTGRHFDIDKILEEMRT